jgi:hypothetical protein
VFKVKRDMELVRDLLLLIENSNDNKELKIPEEWDREIVAYHLKILDQAGYVKDNTKWASDKPMWLIASLTWEGHEFLDSIKNDNVWVKTKEGVKKKGLELGSIPLDLLKEYASIQIKSILGV